MLNALKRKDDNINNNKYVNNAALVCSLDVQMMTKISTNLTTKHIALQKHSISMEMCLRLSEVVLARLMLTMQASLIMRHSYHLKPAGLRSVSLEFYCFSNNCAKAQNVS